MSADDVKKGEREGGFVFLKIFFRRGDARRGDRGVFRTTDGAFFVKYFHETKE